MKTACELGVKVFVATGFLALHNTAIAASTASLTSPPGAMTTITITLNVSSTFGSSSDEDSDTLVTIGTAELVLLPDDPPFGEIELTAAEFSYGPASFTFQLLCIPFIGCQTLDVTLTNLTFTLLNPRCASVEKGGAMTFEKAMFSVSGTATYSGLVTETKILNGIVAADFARSLSAAGRTVTLSQLALADQTIELPPRDLPDGITALSFTFHTDLSGTTLSGPFGPSPESFDLDNDGVLDGCDVCVDQDDDGFGAPGFSESLCPVDNCPDVYNPDQLDSDRDGIGDTCETPRCAEDLDGSGTVNGFDLALLLGSWGACVDCLADLDGNGVINGFDLAMLLAAWGGSCRLMVDVGEPLGHVGMPGAEAIPRFSGMA